VFYCNFIERIVNLYQHAEHLLGETLTYVLATAKIFTAFLGREIVNFFDPYNYKTGLVVLGIMLIVLVGLPALFSIFS
jgi:hypothetical protein